MKEEKAEAREEEEEIEIGTEEIDEEAVMIEKKVAREEIEEEAIEMIGEEKTREEIGIEIEAREEIEIEVAREEEVVMIETKIKAKERRDINL
jgi:hypothetical protein